MIRSMTGFGAAQISADGWTVSAECRSVNQKALEVKVYLPRQISTFEPQVLESIKSVVRRGRVDVRFEVHRESGTQTAVDEVRFAEIANTLKQLAEANRLAPPLVSDVLSFREVHASADHNGEVNVEVLAQVTEQAVAQLVASRSEEGSKLAQTVRQLVSQIETLVKVVEASGPRIVEEFGAKLEGRVRDALEKFGVSELDGHRVAQEIVIYADRSDIAEEIQRTRSHLSKLVDLLDTPSDEPCGKRIDFYLQELFREANTMGSKSSAVELTDAVVGIKSAIEQMREQAANIE